MTAPYDRRAKQVCYLIGTAFLKAGGPYEEFYRRQRAKLDVERPGWATVRKHLTCLRKTEKLFLSHLWLVWREAVGLPITLPYIMREEQGFIAPEEMTGRASTARVSRRTHTTRPVMQPV
jgi:hypothetical protein